MKKEDKAMNKQHIKQVIILALMLVGNITAWADETLTFTFSIDNQHNSYLVWNNNRYQLNDQSYAWNTATVTVGGVTFTAQFAQGNKEYVSGMSSSFDAYAQGYRYILNFSDAVTMTFACDASKYISRVKVYWTNQSGGVKDAYNNTNSCSVSCTKYEHVYKIDVTVTDTKPVLDIANATISGIADSYDYTGSAIEPAITGVTLKNGTTPDISLTAGSDYTVSFANNINAGTATVTLTAQGDYTGTCSRDFTINKVTPAVTVPTPVNTDYNATVQPLCTGGSATGGTLMYSIDGGTTWSPDVPMAVNVGTYDVYYRVDADQNHNDIAATLAGTATINAAVANIGCLAFNATSPTDISLVIGESDGTAAKDITITLDIDVNSITMQRTFTVGKAATVMLPFSIAVSKVSGGTFYSFIGVDKSGDEWEVVMQELNCVSGTLQAHTPYLFMPSADAMTFNLEGQTVTVKANSQQTYIVQP